MGFENWDLKRLPKVNLPSLIPEFPEAKGSAYFGKPVFQAHIFPESYTLLWRTDPTDPQVVGNYSKILKGIAKSWLAYGNGISGDLVVSTVMGPNPNNPSQKSLMEQSLKYGIGVNSVNEVDVSVGSFLDARWSRTASFMSQLGSGKRQFIFWSEGPQDPYDKEEIAVNAPLAFFPTKIYAEMIERTGMDFKGASLEKLVGFMEKVKSDHSLG